MTIQIEHQIYEWDSDTAGVFLKLCNLLISSQNHEELELALKQTPFREQLKNHFLWGWGSKHLWVAQRCPYNNNVVKSRLLIVEF